MNGLATRHEPCDAVASLMLKLFDGSWSCDGLGRQRDRRRKYDYRKHWVAFTSQMSRVHRSDQIGARLAEAVIRAAGARTSAVYLLNPTEAKYLLSASVGGGQFADAIDEAGAIPSWLRTQASPVHLPPDFLSSLPATLSVAIPWHSSLLGFIALGPSRDGIPYTAQDFEFLRTVAKQAAASIMALRLAEAVQPCTVATTERLTAEVIHDIKNSVSALSLLAQNATRRFAEPEFQRDALTTLSRTVDRMRRLVGKLSAKDVETPLSAERINLEELIIEATTPLAGDGRVRLVRQLRPVNAIYGDRDALLRVVENLTTNAAEAIDREGTVTVTLGEEHGYAVISVADTGCGISEEYKERHLFSPFRSTKQGGWGVGLYQTKQAVESQDGEIHVESLEGRGTTFTVKLPLCTGVETHPLESVR